MREACRRVGEDHWTERKALAHADVPAFIATLVRRGEGKDIPHGWVPETTFWIVDGDRVVGEIEIRHPLNDYLQQIGGNIGYLVHPGYRNLGVATFALREGRKILGSMGVREPLATCRDDNAPSIRVLEKCGGIRAENSNRPGPLRRRYTFVDLRRRAARAQDREFVERVYFETQRWIIERLFGWRGDDAEKLKFEEFYDEANSSIIFYDGADVGWLTLARAEDAFDLDGIYISPGYQRRGFGTVLIRTIANEAREAGVRLRLSTAKINPARELYARLGLRTVREDAFKVYMETERRDARRSQRDRDAFDVGVGDGGEARDAGA